ncbi:hypothetical protein G6F31_019503 [Rhizopus arrhizus]|nr:hypothetical protein G6F31_019503 [Rhizopus arrhizus]
MRSNSCTRHSNATGDCITRGTPMRSDGDSTRPASTDSSTPAGKSTAVTFIRAASRTDTRLTVNSPRSAMLRAVSLGAPSRIPMPTQISGGSPDIRLKNEKGATFVAPRASRDTIQAMGRGTIAAVSSL